MDYRIFKNTEAWELAKAARDENIEKIKTELSKIPIDYKDSVYGHTVLMCAVLNNNMKSVKTLLELGADPNLFSDTVCHSGENSVLMACEYDVISIDILDELLKHGGNPNSHCLGKVKNNLGIYEKDSTSALGFACGQSNSIKKVQLLVDYGADINRIYFGNCPEPLYFSLIFDMETTLYLLENGSVFNCNFESDPTKPEKDINWKLRRHLFPLDSDEYKAKMKVVEFLKSHGIDYFKSEIPDISLEEIKIKYPNNWEYYAEHY